jgi:hypothetical protein
LDLTFLIAGTLVLVHLCAGWVRRHLPFHATIGSFGGGMAVTYVFLQLIPELEREHEIYGSYAHLLLLVGFVTFYGIEHLLLRKRRPSENGEVPALSAFPLHIGLYWVYNCLVICGSPEQLQRNAIHAVLISVTMGLHFLSKDLHFDEHYGSRFHRWGRWVLATAPVAGFAFNTWAEGAQERLADLFLGLLGGVVLLTVARDELPNHREAAFLPFLGGVLLFAGLLGVSMLLVGTR